MASSHRYHINKITNRSNICRAPSPEECPLGENTPHFDTKEEANEYIEKISAEENQKFSSLKKQKPKEKTPEEILREKIDAENEIIIAEAIRQGKKKFEGRYDGERDIVDGNIGTWDVTVPDKYSRFGRKFFMPDNAGRLDDPSTLPDSFTSDKWKGIVRPSELSGNLTGIKEAQKQYIRNLNSNEDPTRKEEDLFLNGKASQYTDEIVRRYLAGDRSKWDYETYNRNFYNMSPKEKLLYILSEDDNAITSRNDAYNALILPENDLMPVLDRLGVDNVSITTLNNGRETGLIYTVMTPEMNTRSFALFERRNYDSMGIVGMENWNPEEKPYGPYPDNRSGTTSKYDLFAEMAYDTPPKRRAETLAYFLKSAQEGTLESDQELMDKAEHLDWNAILSEKLGAPYKEFLEKNGVKKQESLEEKMNQLDEQDDFDSWENQF